MLTRWISFVLGLVLTSSCLAGSQDEYLKILARRDFKPWHYAPWNAVLHPIDYWFKHSREERREASRKFYNFVQGREVLPEGFHETQVRAGGITLPAALHLADEERRPLVIMLPGTFGSHLSSYISETAKLLAMSGRFHVMVLGTRMSSRTIQREKVIGSGGWFEGQDVLAAIRWIRSDSPWAAQVSRIGLYGVSLSSDFVVQALAADEDRQIGAAMVVSGTFDAEGVAREIDHKGKGWRVLRHPWALLMLKALRLHLKEVRDSLGLEFTDRQIDRMGLLDYPARFSWTFYADQFREQFGPDFDYEDYRQLTVSLNSISKVRVPMLAIHSHQDRWLGSVHADRMAEAARDNPHVKLHYVDRTEHAAYFVHDPNWFRYLLETYFTYWLDPPPIPAGYAVPGEIARPAAMPESEAMDVWEADLRRSIEDELQEQAGEDQEEQQ